MGNIKGKNNPNYRTGLKIKGNPHASIYNAWCNMKQRCSNKNNKHYHRYAGRGISVCDDWKSIYNFYEWAISNGWENGLTLDRIDNDGNYCPENCQWISMSENSRKKRTTKITFDQAKEIRKRVKNGECQYDLAKEYNVVHGTIWFIIKNFTHVKEGECTRKLKARNNDKP